jgi:DNA-directed RNA polymerase specialized sigma24 family protein
VGIETSDTSPDASGDTNRDASHDSSRDANRGASLDLLRQRFRVIARGRVPADAVDDIVQDAMLVIVRKAKSSGGAEQARDADSAGRTVTSAGLPALPWCFQVLRNMIGNYYLHRARRAGDRPLDCPDEHASLDATPVEALEAKELRAALAESLAAMRASDPQCGRYIGRLLDGATPAVLAAEEGVEQGALYRRMYRCRMKLRGLLAERGIRV